MNGKLKIPIVVYYYYNVNNYGKKKNIKINSCNTVVKANNLDLSSM